MRKLFSMYQHVLIIGDPIFTESVTEILAQANYLSHKCSSLDHLSEKINHSDVVILDEDYVPLKDKALLLRISECVKKYNKIFLIVSSRKAPLAVIDAFDKGFHHFIVKPYNHREFISNLNAIVEKRLRIICIGGGTGLFTLLMGLKMLKGVHLTSIVSMSDDGGSSGRLKVAFGMLPPGDIRRSLVALSNAPDLMNDILQYRFQRGDELEGHNFGNFFLAALAEIRGSLSEAVRVLGDILNISGVVLPVTNIPTTLCSEFEDGTMIMGESKIDLAKDRSVNLSIERIWHEPPTSLNVDAASAIVNCDVIILGPGDLFTSVLTNFLVAGFRDVMKKSPAIKIYVCNLMTKPGETTNFGVKQHVQQVVKYLGEDILDYVIVSNTPLSQEAIFEYAIKQQHPVQLQSMEDLKGITKAKIVFADIGHGTNLVRHDSKKLSNKIMSVIQESERF